MDHAEHLHHAVEFSYWAAFMVGLLGSGHCIGMCGGLVSAFFMKLQAKGPWPYLTYHAGRIAVYAVVGLIAALLGAVLVSTGRLGLAQGILQIVAGLVIIVLGFDLLGWPDPYTRASRAAAAQAVHGATRKAGTRRIDHGAINDLSLDDNNAGQHRAQSTGACCSCSPLAPAVDAASVLFGKSASACQLLQGRGAVRHRTRCRHSGRNRYFS
jgi:hypothetical protein